MPTIDELPHGVDLMLYRVESEAEALRLNQTIKASLYHSKIIDALYLVLVIG